MAWQDFQLIWHNGPQLHYGESDPHAWLPSGMEREREREIRQFPRREQDIAANLH